MEGPEDAVPVGDAEFRLPESSNVPAASKDEPVQVTARWLPLPGSHNPDTPSDVADARLEVTLRIGEGWYVHGEGFGEHSPFAELLFEG